MDADVLVKLSEEESEIRAHLVHGEPLSEQLMEKTVSQFWNQEPYKYIPVEIRTVLKLEY